MLRCPIPALLLGLILLPLAPTLGQDAAPAGANAAPAAAGDEWIDDRQLENALLQGSIALIDGGRAAEFDVIKQGLSNKACDLDLPDAPAQASNRATHATSRVNSDALYGQARESVVVVGSAYKCPRCTNWHTGGATGFFLTSDGVVVTNYHVVDQEDKRSLFVMTSDGRVFPVVESLAGDKAADVAIVRIEPVDQHGQRATFKPLTLATGTRVGQNVRVIHHADSRYYTLTEGIVSRKYVSPQQGNSRWITITADYARGSSGGPLFDDAGHVIGIVASTSSVYYSNDEDGTPQNLQMVWKQCVPVENIRALIE